MRPEGLRYAQVTTGLDDGHAPARRPYAKAGFEKGLGSITCTRKLCPDRVGGRSRKP